ncbi:hypothetical protein K7X08_021393 [Anisodus acutangulus]|uniref:Uncharacterized protein n=1 Tax=Anisodus acutangulus TaxID=402998 RepID=A0A9Q1LZB5_9SOLA|nr:hypothetical protein K7X08_021393 [Anisodus acutangulus]
MFQQMPVRLNSQRLIQKERSDRVDLCGMSSDNQLRARLEVSSSRRRHKAKCEGLKTCKQMAKSEERSSDTTKSNRLNQEQVKHAALTRLEHGANKAVKSVKESNVQIEKKTTNCGRLKKQRFQQMPIEKKTTIAGRSKKQWFQRDAGEIKLPETNFRKNVQTEWTCAVCQVTTNSEHDLKSHLLGRRHKAMCEGLKTCKQTAKSEERSSDTTKSNQLNQEQVKHAILSDREHAANKAAEPKQESNVQIEKKTTAVQIKETAVPADAGEIKLPETNSVKNVQTDWTCAVCQVTTNSEHDLKSHLLGRRHKAKCEGLKTCKQTAKSEERPNDTTKLNQLNQEQVKHAATTRLEHSANKVAEPKQVKNVKESNAQIEKKTTPCRSKKQWVPADAGRLNSQRLILRKNVETEWTCAVKSVKESNVQIEKKTTAVQIKETAVPADAGEIKLPETNSVKNVQTEWTCAVCQVTTNSEHDLKSHLLGRRHKAKCEGLKTCKQTAKSEERPNDTTKLNQLNQEQVKHAATTRLEHSANKVAEPKQVKSVKESNVQIEKKTTAVQIKETAVPADAGEIKLPETNSVKNVQTEWTCAVCQVTTTSEHVLKSHLLGRRHKAKCEGLKTCKQMAKSEERSHDTTKPNQLNQEQVKHAATARSEHSANKTSEPRQVKSVKESNVQIEKKTTAVQIKETAVPADAGEIKLPETNSVKNVQTEWTCAVCQVTTTSEFVWKSHLLGRRHKAKCEGLKTCKQTAKSEERSNDTTKSNQLNQEQVKHAATERSEHSANKGAEPKQVKNVKENDVQIEKKTTAVQIKETSVPADAGEIKLPETNSVKNVQTDWTCAVCQVTTNSEHDLKSHLLGRRHKAKCEGLKTCKQTAKSEERSNDTTKSNQLNQEQVKHAATTRLEHSANKAAEPQQVTSVKESNVQIEKKTTAVQIKETAVPADAGEIKLPETNSVKNVQTEWTCAVCQVTTNSEHDLKSHLLGRRHKAMCEGLKTCKQTAKSEERSNDTTKSNQLNQEQVKHAATTRLEHSANKAAEPQQVTSVKESNVRLRRKQQIASADQRNVVPKRRVKSVKESNVQIEKKTTAVQIKETAVPADAGEIKLPETNSVKNVQTEWTCAVCQVTTTSEFVWKSHLLGRRHKAKCEGLKTCKQTAKSEERSNDTTKSNQLNQEQVKHAATTRLEHSANKAAEPKQTEWTCAVCQVTTNSEHDLKSHLLGRRHKAMCEGLKTCKQTAKSEERSSDTTKSNQLNQEQVKHAATERSEHSANKAAEPKQVTSVKESNVQIEKKTTAVQIKETAVPADAGEIKLPETNSVKNVQTEWTCAVCQVTTNSEHDLKSHLLGWRHKAKCEGLKTCKQTAKSEERSNDTTKSNQLNQEQVKHAATTRLEHSANKSAEPKQESNVQIEKKTTAVQIKETAVPADAGEIKLLETNAERALTEWTCAVCQVTTNSEHDLKSHLLGWRHKAKCEGLKTCKQTAKSEERSNDTTKSNQLNQEQVKHAATTRLEHSANKAAEPQQVKIVKESNVHIEKKTTAVQIKETAVPADVGEMKLPETNSVKNVQTEWTCAVCQVTTNSEHDLKSHLLGWRHKAKCEGLKTCKQTAKSEERSNDTTKSNHLNQEQVKHATKTIEHSANKAVSPSELLFLTLKLPWSFLGYYTLTSIARDAIVEQPIVADLKQLIDQKRRT